MKQIKPKTRNLRRSYHPQKEDSHLQTSLCGPLLVSSHVPVVDLVILEDPAWARRIRAKPKSLVDEFELLSSQVY